MGSWAWTGRRPPTPLVLHPHSKGVFSFFVYFLLFGHSVVSVLCLFKSLFCLFLVILCAVSLILHFPLFIFDNLLLLDLFLFDHFVFLHVFACWSFASQRNMKNQLLNCLIKISHGGNFCKSFSSYSWIQTVTRFCCLMHQTYVFVFVVLGNYWTDPFVC